MKKVLRVGYHRYCREDLFERHLAYIRENAALIDELTLFADYSHYGYWELEGEAENAARLRDRIRRYREVGIKSIGVNLLCTMGHAEEGWDVFPVSPFPYQVNEAGETSRSCLCPANAEFLDYVAKRYALYAKTGADFIWMDDDMRTYNHGVAYNFCFCDACIADFNSQMQTDFGRAELVKQISSDRRIAAAWEARKDRVMLRLFETVEHAVHEADPAVEIGYMSGRKNAQRDWILKSGAKKLRPGGGFYRDERPLELFEKHYSVQRQLSNYPREIRDIQYEYEAFNYQTMERSRHLSELETSLSLMAGCTGVLYNDDMFYDRPQTTDMLRDSHKKWAILNRLNEGCLPGGVYCRNAALSRRLCEIGIPVTHFIENAVAAVLTGKDLAEISRDEIEAVLALNLLTDGEGVVLLQSLGFGEACGANVRAVYDNGMAERFAGHSVNGEFGDYYRDVFMNFKYVYGHEDKAYEFAPSAEAEVLSCLETITHKPLGCSLYRIEHADGRRFAADGYLFPESIKSAAKKEQLGNLIDWLSDARLPVRVTKPVKIMPAVMTNGEGEMTLMLTNASFDPSGALECTVRGKGTFYALGNAGERLPLCQEMRGEETRIRLDGIAPWSYILITNRV